MPRVLYVASILQEAPVLLPVPPVAGGAPCWNIYRMSEALAELPAKEVELKIVSACEQEQIQALKAYPQNGHYTWYVVHPFDQKLSRTLGNYRYLTAAVRRSMGTPSWLASRYLAWVHDLWRTGDFDILILDDAPQNLGTLQRFIPKERLGFVFRGQIGGSRRHLPGCGFIVSTNPVLSDYIREVMPEGHSTTSPPIYVVPNSLDSAFSQPLARPTRTSEAVNIVFAGRVVQEKGVVELITAFSKAHFQNPRIRLTIAGASHYNATELSSYERETRQLAAQLPEGAVEFLGYIRADRMAEVYSSADLAVFPSVWVEGFGMVALEAMRCGVPVIVSNRPGFRSFIQHGKNGIIVDDPEDSDALANAIIDFADDPLKRSQLAKQGQLTSLEYTPEASAQAFSDAIARYWTSVCERKA